MYSPLTRIINFRYRGPMESYKMNRFVNDISCDVEILYNLSGDLESKIRSLSSIIIMGEYIDVRNVNTL